MEEQVPDLITRVDEALTSDALRPRAKAFLLLRLCQICLTVSPSRATRYWEQLVSLQKHVPQDLSSLLNDLRQAFDQRPVSSKGFAAKRIAEINTLLSDAEATTEHVQAQLKACEEFLRKRWWPFGKKDVWDALAKAWADIDRAYALKWRKPGRSA